MLTRTDDTNAFGQAEFLKININIPEGQLVSKAIFVINKEIKLEYQTPEFPLKINLNSEQTKALKDDNNCDLILYDASDRQLTVHCVAHFKSEKEVL